MRQLSDEEMNILEQLPSNVSGVDENTDEQQIAEEPKQEQEVESVEDAPKVNQLQAMIGKKVHYKEVEQQESDEIKEEAKRKNIQIGANIFDNAEMKDGWQVVERELLGERSIYYPQDWEFRVRPATVEAIRNWSTIDDENANIVDDVFNEIIKSCVSIKTSHGLIPWGNIRSWDRFYFLLLVRQLTMINGENKIEYTDECPECDNSVKFVLNSETIQFDLPDPEVMKYYDPETCTWMIDPAEYDVDGEVFTLYLPNLEKDANIKQWIINRVQNKKKIDSVFIKFLPWMAKSISKNEEVANRQIREIEMRFKSLDSEMFSFMNEVIDNIIVMPSTKLTVQCPTCGEEVTTNIRFPNGVSELFNIKRKGKKFGKK